MNGSFLLDTNAAISLFSDDAALTGTARFRTHCAKGRPIPENDVWI
jgi:hypothetical protein